MNTTDLIVPSIPETFLTIYHNNISSKQEMPLHYHDFYEAFYIVRGQIEYRIEGFVYTLLPGTLLLIRPSFLHKAHGIEGEKCEGFCLRIDKDYITSFSEYNVDLTLGFHQDVQLFQLSIQENSLVSDLFQKLLLESGSSDYGSKLYANGLFHQLMVVINRIVLCNKKSSSMSPKNSALVSSAIEYINEHFCEDISLDTLAQSLFINKYYLSHVFRSTMGISIGKYITIKRLLAAKVTLQNGHSPGEVYLQCGFKDYSNFYRAFRSEFGISPKDMRIT